MSGCKDEPTKTTAAGDNAESSAPETPAAAPTGPSAPRSIEHAIDKAWAFYSTRPTFQQPEPPTEVPRGLPDMRAKTCGSCHQAIYQEWQISTHRRAWLDDAQLQAELSKSRGHADPDTQHDVGWMCVNCHTPEIGQLPDLVTGLDGGNIAKPTYANNPTYDKAFQHDAITCATCHVDGGVVYGPYADVDAPHPTAKDPDLRTEKVCTQCHEAQATFPEQNLGCFFTTGQEWAASRYAERGQPCQSCHMPAVTRKLAAGFDRPKRKTRRHWFGGSLIPKKPRFADQLKPLEKIYGSGVEIELIRAAPDAKPAGKPDPEFGQKSTRCAPNAPCTRLWVRLTNTNAGHKFPTGDPERHADIEAVARGADGQIIGRARDRIASHYKWWPTIKKTSSNRIPPGQSHDIILQVPGRYEGFSVDIVAHKYRMYEDAFEHHKLDGKYVRGRVFHTSRWTVDIAGQPTLDHISDDWGKRQRLAHDRAASAAETSR